MNRFVNAPPFDDVEPKVVDDLVSVAEFHTYPDRSLICREGDVMSGVSFVLDGLVRLFLCGPSSREVTLDLMTAGHQLGGVAVFAQEGRYDFSAESVGGAVLTFVPARALRRGIERSPALARSFLGCAAGYSGRWVEAVRRCAFADVEQRVIEALLQAAGAHHSGVGTGRVPVSLSHSQLARLASCTKRSAMRVVRGLCEAGALARSQNGWELDFERLQARSERRATV